MDKEMHLTKADDAAYNATSQLLKAAMNYVNPSAARALAVLSKSIELNHMMDYLHNADVAACDYEGPSAAPDEILKDLRKYCGEKEKEQLDRCLNMMNMANMMSKMATDANTSQAFQAFANMTAQSHNQNANHSADTQSENDYFKQLQAMLTPEQRSLFNMIRQNQNH